MNCILRVTIYPWVLTRSGGKVCEILNAVSEPVAEMERRGTKFPSAKRVRAFSVASIVIGGFVLALYALVSIDGQYGSALGGGPGAFASAVLKYNAKLVDGLTSASVEVGEGKDDALNWRGGLTTAGILFFTWWFSILWSGAYLLTIGWALMLWIILDRFMNLMEKHPSANLIQVE